MQPASIYALLQNHTSLYYLDLLDRLFLQPIETLNSWNLEEKISFNLDLDLFEIFDEFQWKLCKILAFIVLVNFALIYFFWRVYGDRVIDKFMQPSSSSKLIEELKNSISELKLPKEHSPRL